MDAASQADHTCHSRWFKIPPNPGKPATWSFSSQANVSLAQELGLSLAEPAVRDHGQVGKQIAPKILGCERLSAPASCGAVDWVWEGGREGTLQWYQMAFGKAWVIYSQVVHTRHLGPYMKCDLEHSFSDWKGGLY